MDDVTKIGIIVTMASAVICPMIASVKNRSAVGWFFGGLLLGGLGFIIICCLPSVKSESEIREEIREEIERGNARNRKYDAPREHERIGRKRYDEYWQRRYVVRTENNDDEYENKYDEYQGSSETDECEDDDIF